MTLAQDAAAAGWAHGRIPFRLRVGVTGHRELADPERVQEQVRIATARIRAVFGDAPSIPVAFTVISPLAEGADRLVAAEFLKVPGTLLDVPLPLPLTDYETDFKTPASLAEFRNLLGQAGATVTLPPQPERNQAYLQAGRYVVDTSDVIIAVWDGRPAAGAGGTADVVAYADEQRRPLVWLHAVTGAVEVRRLPSLKEGDFEEHLQFNSAHAEAKATGLAAAAFAQALGNTLAHPLADDVFNWIAPYYARADTLAQNRQAAHNRLGILKALLPAFAVVAVAGQVLFASDGSPLAMLEAAVLAAILIVVVLGRQQGYRDQWLAYRFLAERFRSAYFLALIGLERREERVAVIYPSHPSESWVARAFREVWRRKPGIISPPETSMLRALLVTAWVREQADYHRRAAARQHNLQRLMKRTVEVLFFLTLVAAVGHALQVGNFQRGSEANLGTMLVFAATAFPGIAAALASIREAREFERNAQRSRQMAHHLTALAGRMEEASDLRQLQQVAAEVEELLLQENRDWFVVMRFHDFELAP